MTIDQEITLRSVEDFVRYLNLKPPVRRAVFKKGMGDSDGIVEYYIVVPEDGAKVMARICVNPTTDDRWYPLDGFSGWQYTSCQVLATKDDYGAGRLKQSGIPTLRQKLASFDCDPAVTEPLITKIVLEMTERQALALKVQQTHGDARKEAVEALKARREAADTSIMTFNGQLRGETVVMGLRMEAMEVNMVQWTVEDRRATYTSKKDDVVKANGYEIFE